MKTWEAEARLRIAREQIMAVVDDGVVGCCCFDGPKLLRMASEIDAYRESLAIAAPRLDDSVVYMAQSVRQAIDDTRPHENFSIRCHIDDAWAFVEAMGLDGPEGDNA